MKTIIGFLLVLAIFGTAKSLQFGWSSENSVIRVKRYDQSYLDGLVDRYNRYRKKFEAGSNIGAVPNLTWDPALEKLAKEFPSDCHQWKHGIDYRILPFLMPDESGNYYSLEYLSPGHQDFQNLTSAQRALLKKMNDYMDANADRWIMYDLEYLNEQQTKVACVLTQCDATSPPGLPQRLYFKPTYKIEGLCIFGPTNKFNPQIRKETYTASLIYLNNATIHRVARIAEDLAPYLPDGSQGHLDNLPGQPSQKSPPTQSAYAQAPPDQSAPAQSAPAQGNPEKQQASTPSSPASTSTSATGWISVVVLVLGSFF